MHLDIVVTPGLGDNSYLVASEGEAVVVDPQRDAWRFLRAAEARGVRIRRVVETHVHNDYVSGALELAAATGAEICVPARGGYRFDHVPLEEGDVVEAGGVRLSVWETPGHTPEHLSYLLFDEDADEPSGAFTGGSLIVASAGRTDLLGERLAEELTRAQYRSLRRLAGLPPAARVLPTHGAGSFCASTAPADVRTSTIGAETVENPALSAPDEEAFVAQQLSGLLAYPTYYASMAPINRAGPPVLGGLPSPPALGPDEIAARLARGEWVIDARDRESYARGHVPGSLNVELEETFATYVGWVVPFGEPVSLVLPGDPGAFEEAVTQLFRIGWDRVEGHLEGGVDRWAADGRAVASFPTASVADLCRSVRGDERPFVLDVRQPSEWEEGLVPGSETLFVGDLPAHLSSVPRDREVWVICASGLRASVAASLLDRAGRRVRLVSGGGAGDWPTVCPPAGAVA